MHVGLLASDGCFRLEKPEAKHGGASITSDKPPIGNATPAGPWPNRIREPRASLRSAAPDDFTVSGQAEPQVSTVRPGVNG